MAIVGRWVTSVCLQGDHYPIRNKAVLYLRISYESKLHVEIERLQSIFAGGITPAHDIIVSFSGGCDLLHFARVECRHWVPHRVGALARSSDGYNRGHGHWHERHTYVRYEV